MTDITAVELTPEDDILAYSQSKRKDLVEAVIQNGMPGDTASRNILLTALADMDRVALGRKRIKVEEKQNSNQEATAGLIAQMFKMAAGKPLFQADEPRERPAPALGDDVPAPTLVPGETDTQVSSDTYQTFMQRQTNKD